MADLPIACTLGPSDGADRLARWRRLGEQAAPVAHRDGPRLTVRYRPVPGVRDELQSLAAAEAGCCGFATWSVSEESGAVLLHVAADPSRPDDIAPIATLFGA